MPRLALRRPRSSADVPPRPRPTPACFRTPDLNKYISGVILHWETLFQTDAAGNKMVDLITKNGMIPGIKLDKVGAFLPSRELLTC